MVPAWWNRNLTLVIAARVAMSTGRVLAGVVTPIYLALEGFSALRLSVYVLTVALCSAVLSASSGTLSDRVGRRPFLVVMPLLTAAAGVTFAFTASVPALFLMGALGSFGRGSGAGAGAVGPYQPTEQAFVTDMLAARHRNDAFGRMAFGSSLGATVGGVLALLVSTSTVHGAAATAAFRGAFLAIAGVSAAAGLIALWLTEQPRRPASPLPDAVRRRVLPRRSRWLLHRLWITNGLNGMAIGMFGPFVTYWFFRRFGAGAGEVGLLFAVINAATTVSVLSAAGLARRWGVVRTVVLVRTAQALLLVPMVLAPSFALAGAVYFVRMIVQRIGLPLRQSYTIGLADPEERGAVAALSNLPAQLTMAASPLLTGYLFDEVSLSLPFELAAVFQMANAATFWGFFRHRPPDDEAASGPGRREHDALVARRADRPSGSGTAGDLGRRSAALRGPDRPRTGKAAGGRSRRRGTWRDSRHGRHNQAVAFLGNRTMTPGGCGSMTNQERPGHPGRDRRT
jgi:MFS family permease